MSWEQLPGRRRCVDSCELCEEARLTEWFYEDDDCWVAECESCNVPMIVWRNHANDPSAAVKAALHTKLVEVVEANFDYALYIDDDLRSIPEHYHAHARSKAGPFGRGIKRRSPST